jgi:hypothetical protein
VQPPMRRGKRRRRGRLPSCSIVFFSFQHSFFSKKMLRRRRGDCFSGTNCNGPVMHQDRRPGNKRRSSSARFVAQKQKAPPGLGEPLHRPGRQLIRAAHPRP